MTEKPLRIAVLIDADNASATHAPAIFEEIKDLGSANVRRIYGNFTEDRLKKWIEQLQPLAIDPRQQFNYTTGKNAADITLVIEAMDLMHTAPIDMFCLVSSDSDFTRLAQRLREAGKTVYGFGDRKAPQAFRNACNRFIYFDNLGAANETPVEVTKEPPSKAIPLLLKAMKGAEDDKGWIHGSGLKTRLLAIAPDFDERTYGCTKFSDVVRRSGGFEVKSGSGTAILIRRKPVKTAKPKK